MAMAFVVLSNAFPGACSWLHIQELDVIHIDNATIRNSFITSTALRPSIIIQHSYEPTHSARQSPMTRA